MPQADDPSRIAHEALATMARALVPFLRAELGLDPRDPERKWMCASDTPVPRHAKQAAREGRIRGARKVARRWVFEVQAWDEYLAGLPEARHVSPRTPGVSEVDQVVADLRSELGLAPRGAPSMIAPPPRDHR
jgi:hypothetical protein